MTEQEALTKITPRYRKVYESKKSGFSFREIGNDLRISAGRTSQIFYSAQRRIKNFMEDGDWAFLSVRAKNAIADYFGKSWWDNPDFKPTKSEVRKAITEGWNPLKNRNVGKETHREIVAWAEVPKTCPCCGRPV